MAVMLRRERGFNLIELMIVVAVLGIIAAVAFPAYQDYVRKGKRAEGKAALLEAAQMMERYYTNNNAYSASLSAIGYPAGRISGGSAYSSDSPSNAAYTLSAVVAGGGSSFTITATPANNHVDPKCGNLSINQAGQKGRTGTAPVNECW